MSVQITHVRYEDRNNKSHQSITAYAYKEDATGQTGSKWKADMVAYLEAGTSAHVGVGANSVPVGVVDATPKYLRTYADGFYNNNLLSLDEF